MHFCVFVCAHVVALSYGGERFRDSDNMNANMSPVCMYVWRCHTWHCSESLCCSSVCFCPGLTSSCQRGETRRKKMSITTIRVTRQLAACQLNMVVKCHITAAINSKSKSSQSTESSTEIKRPTLPPSGLMVLPRNLAPVVSVLKMQ